MTCGDTTESITDLVPLIKVPVASRVGTFRLGPMVALSKIPPLAYLVTDSLAREHLYICFPGDHIDLFKKFRVLPQAGGSRANYHCSCLHLLGKAQDLTQ